MKNKSKEAYLLGTRWCQYAGTGTGGAGRRGAGELVITATGGLLIAVLGELVIVVLWGWSSKRWRI